MTTTREEQRDVAKKMVVVNGQSHEIMRPDISDATVASRVRMLMRDQLDHEFVCMLARDRILYLSQELDRLRASQAGGVPAGWKLVPVEPTPQMLANADVGGWPGFDALRAFWGAMLPASPPPPATDGDALRDTLEKIDAEFDRQVYGLPPREDPTPYALREADQDIPADYQHCVVITEGLWDEIRNALASSPPPVPEIVAPQVVSDATADTGSASAAHLEQILPSPDLGQAAELVKPQCDNPSPAALASVPTPVSDGDSVLRKAVALVITHHVNQNRQKRRPESDSFTLKTLREALAATPVSATDAVEAERAIRARGTDEVENG